MAIDAAIVTGNTFSRKLAKAKQNGDIHAMLDLRDLAVGAEKILRARGEREKAQNAKIFQLDAERAAGKWLEENVSAGNPQLLDPQTIGKLPEGVSRFESHCWQLEAAMPEQDYQEWKDACIANDKEITAAALQRIAKRYKVAQKRDEEREENEQSNNILVGDMRTVGDEIGDNSIDMILTDPPYPEEYLTLFTDLSHFAARVLRPGGLCLVYSGQIFLPEVYARLGASLQYLWTFAIRHSGGVQKIFKANVNTAWKPVIAYVKPPLSIYWDSFVDMTTGGMEKDLHEWQQSEAEAAYFIEHLSTPGSVVLDPFCGSGTVLAAAKKLKREYIGIEVSEETAAKASKRLK